MRVCVSVCMCVHVYSVLADSLFVYCQTWVTAAVFCVRVGQTVNWKQVCVYAFGGCGQRGKDREDHFLGLLKSFAFRIENA